MAQYSSIPELREHIEALSSAIEAQEQILQDLRHRRSDAYRDLNFLVDPMARLPLELQSDIFMRCISDSSPGNTTGSTTKPNPNAPPMVFHLRHLRFAYVKPLGEGLNRTVEPLSKSGSPAKALPKSRFDRRLPKREMTYVFLQPPPAFVSTLACPDALADLCATPQWLLEHLLRF
ncbi:hypothetical protein R3P38DRAFT_3617388 [Favolaschia claudopus]|uniref:Uncharacterized protein n=1 Tax=Favolaschia claudopus TaxID=2862362 RepID=A0AAW0A488_9AGAR